jgi:hypothetical protein
MTIEEATCSLNETFNNQSWFVSTAKGKLKDKDCIYLYTKVKTPLMKRDTWEGFPVIVEVQKPIITEVRDQSAVEITESSEQEPIVDEVTEESELTTV